MREQSGGKSDPFPDPRPFPSDEANVKGKWNMSRYAKRVGEDESGVNLTPMLDVVFIMLIFFVVTATFVKEVGLEVNPPEDDTWQPDPKESKIVVRITSRDRILIAQRDVDWRAVRANVERMHAQNPGASVVIQPHPDSRTETMVHVMDSARQAGVSKVSLAAES